MAVVTFVFMAAEGCLLWLAFAPGAPDCELALFGIGLHSDAACRAAPAAFAVFFVLVIAPGLLAQLKGYAGYATAVREDRWIRMLSRPLRAADAAAGPISGPLIAFLAIFGGLWVFFFLVQFG